MTPLAEALACWDDSWDSYEEVWCWDGWLPWLPAQHDWVRALYEYLFGSFW